MKVMKFCLCAPTPWKDPKASVQMLLEENCKFVNQMLHYCNECNNFNVCPSWTVIFTLQWRYFFPRPPKIFYTCVILPLSWVWLVYIPNMSQITFQGGSQVIHDNGWHWPGQTRSICRWHKHLVCNSIGTNFQSRLELRTFQPLIRDSAQATQVRICFPEELLGSFVVCQSQMHGDACQCEKHGLLAELKTRSS